MGQTPTLRHKLTRDPLSVIRAIHPTGELFLHAQESAFARVGIVAFLKTLLQHTEQKLVVVWDGAPIHRSKVVKASLAEGAAARLHLERLPGYAPELNPDEGIWHYLKHVELPNVCCRDIAPLRSELCAAEQRLRDKPHIVQACFKQTGYY